MTPCADGTCGLCSVCLAGDEGTVRPSEGTRSRARRLPPARSVDDPEPAASAWEAPWYARDPEVLDEASLAVLREQNRLARIKAYSYESEPVRLSRWRDWLRADDKERASGREPQLPAAARWAMTYEGPVPEVMLEPEVAPVAPAPDPPAILFELPPPWEPPVPRRVKWKGARGYTAIGNAVTAPTGECFYAFDAEIADDEP